MGRTYAEYFIIDLIKIWFLILSFIMFVKRFLKVKLVGGKKGKAFYKGLLYVCVCYFVPFFT